MKKRLSPRFQILKKFEVFFKKIGSTQKLDAPKNGLVHPELWACHFERFRDLAIFPQVSKATMLTPDTWSCCNVSR